MEGDTSKAFSTHEREENCIHDFGKKSPKEIEHREDLGVDGRTILK
jgi:hypothetical protein